MLKKRILAIQAAIVLSASMMSGVIAPVGNIAIVHAAEAKRKPITWDYIENELSDKYAPGEIYAKYTGKNENVVAGSKIKLTVRNAKPATKNYKEKIYFTKANGTKVYGVRTVNEAASYKEQPFAISRVTDESGETPVDVAPAKFKNYVTVDTSGIVTVVGKKKFSFGVEKQFKGTSEWTVVDTYEDKVTDNQKIKRMKEQQNPETGNYEYVENNDGYTLTQNFEANYGDPTGTNFRYSNGYGTKDTKASFPKNESFRIHGTDSDGYWNYGYDENGEYYEVWVDGFEEYQDNIRTGESAVIPLDAYKPLSESSSNDDDGHELVYNQYDSKTDTYTKVGGVRTIKETVVGKPQVKWAITQVVYTDSKGNQITKKDAATIAKYAEIKNGVFLGKKACTATVTATYKVKSTFAAKNVWDDGIKEEYTFNQGYKDGKETANTVSYVRTARITVKSASDDEYNFYGRQIRLSDIEYSFGSFNDEAKEIKLGKGETKSVADAWGNYNPQNTTNLNNPDQYEYIYYDSKGKRQVKRAQYTLVENKKKITHEYESSNEKIAKVDGNGKVTGKTTGVVTITDKATIRSTFTVTFVWNDGKKQTIETGDQTTTRENTVAIEVVNAAKTNQSFDVVTVDGLKYTIYTDTNTATFKAPADKKKIKKVTVPATIKVNGTKYKVVGIENKALNGCKKLTQLTVKAEVTSLGASALASSSKLETADLSNVKIPVFPDGTFTKCKKLTKLTINGDSLLYIDEDAFAGVPNGAQIIIKVKDWATYKAVVQEFKDAGYTNFKFEYKKVKTK